MPNIVELRDLSGGANIRANKFAIPSGQFSILENFYLMEDGSLVGRRGTSRWNATSLGAGAVQGQTRAYFDAGNRWFAYHGGTIWKGTDATKTFASDLAGLHASASGWFWQYLTFVYFCNKNDAPRKSDGTTWSTMGIAAPTAAPTGAVGAAGTPNGTYTIKYTYASATIESNPSPASGSVTVVNQQINVSGVTVGPAGTTKRRIYAFKNGVSTVYQLVGEINDNVTTTFTITTDQSSWTTSAPTSNDPPLNAIFGLTIFKNRFWAFDGRRVYFSQIFVPEAWAPTFFVDIPFSKNDSVTGLFVLGDVLLIFGHTEVYYVIGDTPFSFVIKRSFAPIGCPSPWAIDRVENAAAYLSRNGILVFDVAQAKALSDAIDPTFVGLIPPFPQMNYAAADKATLKYFDRLKTFTTSIPVGSSTTNNSSWWYFTRRRGWMNDNRKARVFEVADGKGDNGDLYAWDPADGILRQWDPDGIFTDDGIAITARARTGVLLGDDPLLEKIWQWLTLRAQTASVTVTINAYVDQGAETDTFNIDLSKGGSLYGTALYGTGTYAADDDFEERFDGKMKGKGIILDIAATYSVFFRLLQIFLTCLLLPVIRRRVR